MEKAAFSGLFSEHTDILILIQHLTLTSPHQEAKHSIPVCHPLWPGDNLPGNKVASAKSHFLITAQLLPNPDLPSAAFQAGRNACLLAIKASPLWSSMSDSRFLRNKQLLLLTLPSFLGWHQRKQPEKHMEDAVW